MPGALTAPRMTIPPNQTAQAILGYLTSGSIRAARQVAESAEEILYAKVTDPVAAAIGGYYLLRVHDLPRLHNWPLNLNQWMPWLPDGAIIRAWQLIRTQQQEEAIDEAALAAARKALLDAVPASDTWPLSDSSAGGAGCPSTTRSGAGSISSCPRATLGRVHAKVVPDPWSPGAVPSP